MTYFTLLPARIGTDSEDEQGLLVSVDNRIVAVFTQLNAEDNGEARGFWFLEAAFGRCAAPPSEPFQHLSQGLALLAQRLGLDASRFHEEFAMADRQFGSTR